jgi:RNA polymerase sigma-70 factor (ECF subfamily)
MPSSEVNLSAGLSSSSLRRLCERQPEAWQRFLRLYGPLIYSWCRTRWHLRPQESAELLQDVVTRVLETIQDYRRGSFLGWLSAVTRSRVVNYLKNSLGQAAGGSDAQRRLAEIADPHAEEPDPPTPATTPQAEVQTGVLRRALEEVRNRSSASSWQAFWQVTMEGRKPADVALDLGLSANAVYIANSRILQRLRAELGTLEEGPSG